MPPVMAWSFVPTNGKKSGGQGNGINRALEFPISGKRLIFDADLFSAS
jgi:hypothetical protein